MDWKNLINLINALVWPVVVIVAIVVYHKPLGEFLSGLGSRITKLSISEVSLELAALPNPPSPWSSPGITDDLKMLGDEVGSTALMVLFNRIGVETPWDYLLVDIRDGNRWLISRLYIFTVMLSSLRGVKCVVFVESKGEFRRRLIGLASPDSVINALNVEYPWLSAALNNAMIKQNTALLSPLLSPNIAGEIIREFIEQPEMRSSTWQSEDNKWTQLGTQSIWEHTEWLTLDNLNKYLRETFYEWDASFCTINPDEKPDKQSRDLINRRAPFIALVNSKGEFQSLINRNLILEQIAKTL